MSRNTALHSVYTSVQHVSKPNGLGSIALSQARDMTTGLPIQPRQRNAMIEQASSATLHIRSREGSSPRDSFNPWLIRVSRPRKNVREKMQTQSRGQKTIIPGRETLELPGKSSPHLNIFSHEGSSPRNRLVSGLFTSLDKYICATEWSNAAGLGASTKFRVLPQTKKGPTYSSLCSAGCPT